MLQYGIWPFTYDWRLDLWPLKIQKCFHTIALYVCRKTKSKDGDFNEKDVKDFLSDGNNPKEVLMIPAGMYYMITFPKCRKNYNCLSFLARKLGIYT